MIVSNNEFSSILSPLFNNNPLSDKIFNHLITVYLRNKLCVLNQDTDLFDWMKLFILVFKQ